MRTLNFRVWDKKNRKMIYPTIIWNYTEESVNYMFPIFSGIKYDDIDDVSEMMQFTGIIDKNGKEIYEGDILKDNVGEILKIEFRTFRFVALFRNSFGAWINDRDFKDVEFMEVIGNIYENPYLLEKEK